MKDVWFPCLFHLKTDLTYLSIIRFVINIQLYNNNNNDKNVYEKND